MSLSNEVEYSIELETKKIIAIIVVVTLVIVVSVSYIQALIAFTATYSSKPLHVNSLKTQNMNGDEITSFSRGSVITFSVDIEHATNYYYSLPHSYYTYSFVDATDYLLIVQVLRGSTPVFLGFVNQPISPSGTQTTGVGYRINQDTTTGTYTAYVYVWSAWDSSRIVLADNSGISTTFTVTR